jgi:DnaJ-class molecular chaperone
MDIKIWQICGACNGKGVITNMGTARQNSDHSWIVKKYKCPVCDGNKTSEFIIRDVIKYERKYDEKAYGLDT